MLTSKSLIKMLNNTRHRTDTVEPHLKPLITLAWIHLYFLFMVIQPTSFKAHFLVMRPYTLKQTQHSPIFPFSRKYYMSTMEKMCVGVQDNCCLPKVELHRLCPGTDFQIHGEQALHWVIQISLIIFSKTALNPPISKSYIKPAQCTE